MTPRYTIAVDVMGGDFGPHATLPASFDFLAKHSDLDLLLVGDQSEISPWFERRPELSGNVQILHADSVVAMDERPSSALRRGQQSSLYQAINAVASGRAQACVSAGNTGALMAIGRHLLGTFPGIDRPAIVSAIPTRSGHCYMLDLGANVDCSADHLFQFALMGSVLSAALDGVSAPRVALLNIGAEEIKGSEQVRLASRMIREEGALNYVGYIEGDDLYSGCADVVVCDGFVGNVALKSMEGVARLLRESLQEAFQGGWWARVVGALARASLTPLQGRLDPARRNGASLLGLQGIVIKSHGSADSRCFGYALGQAFAEIRQGVPARIHDKLGEIL